MRHRKISGTRVHKRGFISVYVMGVLSFFVAVALSLLTAQEASLKDTTFVGNFSQAKFLAQSALQEARYYVTRVNPGWTGTSPVQTVTIDLAGLGGGSSGGSTGGSTGGSSGGSTGGSTGGSSGGSTGGSGGTSGSSGGSGSETRIIGDFSYTVSKVGTTYTVVATGYVPSATAANKVTESVSTSFTFNAGASTGTGSGTGTGAGTGTGVGTGTGSAPVYIGQGIVVLDSSAEGAFTNSGNSTITISGGNIYVNSSHAKAVKLNGNAVVTAPTINITGDKELTGNATLKGTVKTGTSPVSDPLSSLVPPDKASLTVRSSSTLSVTATKTLDPGVYTGGIHFSGNANATMNAGTYYLEGDFTVQGNAVINATAGVTIFLKTGALNIAGGGTIYIHPPASGDYKNISIYQDPSNTSAGSISGNGTMRLSGAIYMREATLTLAGNGATPNYSSFIVVKKLALAGNSAMTINNYSGSGSLSLRLTPVFECLWDYGVAASPRYRAVYGYNNGLGVTTSVSVGSNNKFTTNPQDRGQPTTFSPGRHTNVFLVWLQGSSDTWKLNNDTVTVTPSSAKCSGTPP